MYMRVFHGSPADQLEMNTALVVVVVTDETVQLSINDVGKHNTCCKLLVSMVSNNPSRHRWMMGTCREIEPTQHLMTHLGAAANQLLMMS